MTGILCPICGSNKLELDTDECKKYKVPVYTCDGCSNLYTLKHIGSKPIGWRTKKKIAEKEFINSIPF